MSSEDKLPATMNLVEARIDLQDCLGRPEPGKEDDRIELKYCKLSDELYHMMDELWELGSEPRNGRLVDRPSCSFPSSKNRKRCRHHGGNRRKSDSTKKSQINSDVQELDAEEHEDTEGHKGKEGDDQRREGADKASIEGDGVNENEVHRGEVHNGPSCSFWVAPSSENESPRKKIYRRGKNQKRNEIKEKSHDNSEALERESNTEEHEDTERPKRKEGDDQGLEVTDEASRENRAKKEEVDVEERGEEHEDTERPKRKEGDDQGLDVTDEASREDRAKKEKVDVEEPAVLVDSEDRREVRDNHGNDSNVNCENRERRDLEDHDKLSVDQTESRGTSSPSGEQSEDTSAKDPQREDGVSGDRCSNFHPLPHPYRPPTAIKVLSELRPSGCLENAIGVVTHFTSVCRSRGTDFVMKIHIIDPTYCNNAREVMFFRPNKWQFPEIHCIGDIVRFHRLKAGRYLGELQLMSNRATSFMVFPGLSTEAVSLENARYQTDNPSLNVDTIRAVQQLREWLKINKDVIRPTSLVPLSAIHENTYCEIVGNVVRAERCQNPEYTLVLTLYDGTAPPSGQAGPAENNESSRPAEQNTGTAEGGEILWDVRDRLPGAEFVRIYVGKKHATVLNDLQVTAGQVVLLHGLWVELDNAGRWNLYLSDEGPNPCGVTLINAKSPLGRKYAMNR